MKPTVKCTEYYSTELYKNGKDKKANQKYLYEKSRRQFTLQSIKKLNNSKYPIYGKGMYLHHKYKYHISFKCNNKQCNHTIKQITPSAIDDPSSEKTFGKDTFSGHRLSINTIINAINLYYSLNATTRAISTHLLDYMNIKVSHITISKWIKKFDNHFKYISDELTKNLYLGDCYECMLIKLS